ncbi:hypothetical protein [Jannaschia sp. M317]|uniref:hypothetical protein n=1 Tax=Jannaschia sp. M317 TaxID=2867011 RepID=UPI0021A391C2|nr:hypothetical protein [Jannaschia sp. M317]UWQ16134.1 hypothetical protein K3551_09285 [Jannaschia sp. M317]
MTAPLPLTPTDDWLRQARTIVSSPTAEQSPTLRGIAWATLMAARGHRCRQHRPPRPPAAPGGTPCLILVSGD